MCDTIDPVEDEPKKRKDDFEPIIEEDLHGPEIIAQIEDYAGRMYALAETKPRATDSLKLNFYDLQEVIDRHCYSKTSAAIHLGQVRRRLKKVQNQIRRRGNELYRAFTDKVLGRNQEVKTDANGKPIKLSTVGVQKMDAEYRSSEYTKDLTYRRLQAKEEKLIEYVTVIEGLYECYQDKARFILGMQKTLNNEGRNSQ